jgi:PadR family transcriptional regulator PadR
MAKKQDGESIVLSALEEDLLTALLGHTQGIYGLDLLNRINVANKKLGRRKIGVGSLYPALKRMEQQGLITGRWGDEDKPGEESGGARRRYYTISADGERALETTWLYRQQLRDAYQVSSEQLALDVFNGLNKSLSKYIRRHLRVGQEELKGV